MLLFVLLFLLILFILFLIYLGFRQNRNVEKYLSKVYPLTNWTQISTWDLNNFYDSLGFVYNPCSEYSGTDLTVINNNPFDVNTPEYNKKVCGGSWSSLGLCEDYSSTRPQKGYLLSFNDYHKNNIHTVYSNGTGQIKDWTSYRQTLHWGVSSTGGEISRTCRSGPGPYWLTPFSIIRDFYYPNGINFKNGVWSIVCNMSPTLDNHGCQWNPGAKNWTMGYKEGDYIEITHAQNNPGMPQSVGFWFNGLPGGGTGMFLKIGKTHVANNKIDALFTLIIKLKSMSVSDLTPLMQNTKSAGKSGSEILHSYYNTDDPYVITWKYANGEWPPMSYVSDGSILVDPRDESWKYIGNKGILNASGLMNSGNIQTTIQDGQGYGPNMAVTFSDIAIWWLKQNKQTQGDITLQANKNLIIDAARLPIKPEDYFPNRAGGMVTPDEAICWLSFVLGIETIQMPLSANDNGLWVYEIIDLRLPTPTNTPGLPEIYSNWLTDSKDRKYSFMNAGPVWNPDAQGWWMNHIQNFISYRDPLNLSNGNNCENIGFFSGLTPGECKNPFKDYPNITGLNSQGFYDEAKRCWVAIENGGWQNLPCKDGTMQQSYVKIPLMYPGDSDSPGEKDENPGYIKNIQQQNPKFYLPLLA